MSAKAQLEPVGAAGQGQGQGRRPTLPRRALPVPPSLQGVELPRGRKRLPWAPIPEEWNRPPFFSQLLHQPALPFARPENGELGSWSDSFDLPHPGRRPRTQ